MKVFWFGDSWSTGSELAFLTSEYGGQLGDRLLTADPTSENYREHFIKKYRPDLAFPALISQDLNLDAYYYVRGGTSINRIYNSFLLDCVKKFDVANSVAIFALPTPWNRFEYYNNEGERVSNWTNKRSNNHELNTFMHKVQLERGLYDTTIFINLIYNTCLVHGIKPYFFSCWRKIMTLENLNVVPKENFYFPLDTTLVDLSWESPFISVQNPCIYPNRIRHPNLEGQKKLAETLKTYVKKSLS